MDDFDKASVLDYARSRGIASNHQQLDPMNPLAQIRDSEHARSLSSSEPLLQLIGFGALGLPNHTSPFASQNGKLVLDKDGVRFLTSVLQDVTSIQASPDHRAEDTIALELKYLPAAQVLLRHGSDPNKVPNALRDRFSFRAQGTPEAEIIEIEKPLWLRWVILLRSWAERPRAACRSVPGSRAGWRPGPRPGRGCRPRRR